MGSGTTAVACKELGRHYIGFEIDPKYYQIALDRLNGLTKEDREKKESGQMRLF
jgi:DNA modification methylase